jgi:DNA-binding FadR family transcriptional regulator
VVTRQGVGAFVAEDTRRPFHIDEDKMRSIQELVQVIELRIGVEVEAAGLAADRATEADRTAIVDACAIIDQAMSRSDNFVEEDFAFHRAVAGWSLSETRAASWWACSTGERDTR